MAYILAVIGYLVSITSMWYLISLTIGKKFSTQAALSVRFAASIIAGLLVVNVLTYGVSSKLSDQSVNVPVSPQEAISAFDFKPGVEYPLSFGGGTDYYSSRIEFDDSTGYFNLYFDNARPLESVALVFSKDEASHIFIVPMSQIEFVQNESEDASIKLYLRDTGGDLDEFDQDYDDIYTVGTYSDCGVMLRNLVLLCDQYVTSQNLVIGKGAIPADLEHIVARYLDHAEITLRASQYNLLLG